MTTTAEGMLNDGVIEAVEELGVLFPDRPLRWEADGQGGAFVIMSDCPLGPQYQQDTTWVGFHVTHMCPFADTYPHYVRQDLERADGAPLGEGFSAGAQWPGLQNSLGEAVGSRLSVQISRRSNRLAADGIETPAIKFLKVMKWLNSR
jgi:hypothetical protein